ncbi:hypothetical protein ACFLT2_01220 [Acidobacteriota bacterium]
MNATLVLGTRIVVIALLSYTLAFVIEQRKTRITRVVLIFQCAGLALDIASTLLMILGSDNTPLSVHGFIGYSALVIMIIKTLLFWRHYKKHGVSGKVSKILHWYSRVAYVWWVVAFILGGLLVFLK